MFVRKAGDYLSEKPLLGRLHALSPYIRLGWKWQTVANTLAYHSMDLFKRGRKKGLLQRQDEIYNIRRQILLNFPGSKFTPGHNKLVRLSLGNILLLQSLIYVLLLTIF